MKFSFFNVISFATLLCTLSSLSLAADSVVPHAQLFEGMGSHTRRITTDSSEAQEYFNQGLIWFYAFNHQEADLSFRKAAELDDKCAMAWWGVAVAAGPNYNDFEFTEDRTKKSWEAMQKALERIENADPIERALIEALQYRYPRQTPTVEEAAVHSRAYAMALKKIWEAHPNDADVGTLYAESLMLLNPWRLYSVDRKTVGENTPEILATLERVIAMDPQNPGPLHLYIHTIEGSPTPSHGLPFAERLGTLVPISSHLTHMPSHIYIQVGMWDRAVEQSKRAMQGDDNYRAKVPWEGELLWTYRPGYPIHNSHMGVFAAMMSGREQDALEAAEDIWSDMPENLLDDLDPYFDHWMCALLDVYKRFGRWDKILAVEAPPENYRTTQATWHAARAIAYAASKEHDFEKAEAEYRQFKKAKKDVEQDEVLWGLELASHVLEVSDYFVQGEIALQKARQAAAEGDKQSSQRYWEQAIELLKEAVEVEDTLVYEEPPQWLQPARHTLGGVYVKCDRLVEAEQVFRRDLEEWPHNVWSLRGLYDSLLGQGRLEEAEEVMTELKEASAHSDVPIDVSCKCLAMP